MHELELLVDEYGYDVITITETLSKRQSHDKDIFNLPGYECFTSDEGRGVCMFVKTIYEVTRMTEIEDLFQPAVFLKILTQSEPQRFIELFL